MSAIQKANVTPDPPFRPTEKRVALKKKVHVPSPGDEIGDLT
jgi:hypothetical protein